MPFSASLMPILQFGNERCGRSVFHLCLLVDHFGSQPSLEAQTGLFHAFAACGQCTSHDGQFVIHGDQLEIGRGYFGHQGHAHRSLGSDRSQIFRIPLPPRPAQFSPQVEFPLRRQFGAQLRVADRRLARVVVRFVLCVDRSAEHGQLFGFAHPVKLSHSLHVGRRSEQVLIVRKRPLDDPAQ